MLETANVFSIKNKNNKNTLIDILNIFIYNYIMRIIALIIIACFLSSCATTYTDVGSKKKSFTPNFDPDCKRDDSIVSGMTAAGFICAHDNGIIFVKSTFSSLIFVSYY